MKKIITLSALPLLLAACTHQKGKMDWSKDCARNHSENFREQSKCEADQTMTDEDRALNSQRVTLGPRKMGPRRRNNVKRTDTRQSNF